MKQYFLVFPAVFALASILMVLAFCDNSRPVAPVETTAPKALEQPVSVPQQVERVTVPVSVPESLGPKNPENPPEEQIPQEPLQEAPQPADNQIAKEQLDELTVLFDDLTSQINSQWPKRDLELQKMVQEIADQMADLMRQIGVKSIKTQSGWHVALFNDGSHGHGA